MDEALADLVRRRAGDCCEYCRLPQAYSSTRFQIDHIIAEQHGGKTVASNLAPFLVAHIEELREDVHRINGTTSAMKKRVAELKEESRTAGERLRQRRQEYEKQSKSIQTRIGQGLLLEEQVAEYESEVGKHEAAVARREQLEASIASAQTERSDLLERHQCQFDQLNDYFGHTLRQLLPDAQGSLVLDNRVGLSPRTDAATGEAIGTEGKVIGFDLACLLAGTMGLGDHPRFLIHDSPREADLERTAYHRLFLWAVDLERSFGEHPPPFQYIVTTTTPPPPALSGTPYVCVTLDARKKAGLLLKSKF